MRTYFASNPVNILAYRFESGKPADYTFSFETPHKKNSETFTSSVYSFLGEVAGNAMQFETRVKIETDGTTHFIDGQLEIAGAKYLIMYHVFATDYINQYPEYKGNDYQADNTKALQNTEGKSFEELLAAHTKDYKALYERVTLKLGDNPRNSLPTNLRLIEYADGAIDFGLEELYFQFGRYMMISASRPGSMPYATWPRSFVW